MNLTRRDKKTIVMGAAAVGLLCLVQFGVMPWLEDWRNARHRAAVARLELDDLEAKVRQVVAQRKHLEEVLGQAVGKPLVSEQEARLRCVKIVQQLLQASGVGVMSMRPQPSRPLTGVEGVTMVSVQTEGGGQFAQFPQCLAAILAADPLLVVEKLSITQPPQPTGEIQIQLVLGTPALQEAAR